MKTAPVDVLPNVKLTLPDLSTTPLAEKELLYILENNSAFILPLEKISAIQVPESFPLKVPDQFPTNYELLIESLS